MSASSSRRWLNCTPSARLEEQFAEETGNSVYAEEGTAAHALAEHKLKRSLKRRSKRPVSDYQCDEMEECTDGYVAYAMEQVELARQECKDPVVLIEQRLDYSAYVPEGFGTGDLLIVADRVLTVVDLKYGKGVAYKITNHAKRGRNRQTEPKSFTETRKQQPCYTHKDGKQARTY